MCICQSLTALGSRCKHNDTNSRNGLEKRSSRVAGGFRGIKNNTYERSIAMRLVMEICSGQPDLPSWDEDRRMGVPLWPTRLE